MTGRNIDRLWLADRMSRRDAFKVGWRPGARGRPQRLRSRQRLRHLRDVSATEAKIEPKIDGDLVYFN